MGIKVVWPAPTAVSQLKPLCEGFSGSSLAQLPVVRELMIQKRCLTEDELDGIKKAISASPPSTTANQINGVIRNKLNRTFVSDEQRHSYDYNPVAPPRGNQQPWSFIYG